MPKRLRPIGHEDRLSVVDHLDELRHRLIICASVLVVAFGFCFWQNDHILSFLNHPYHKGQHTRAHNQIAGIAGGEAGARTHLLNAASGISLLSRQKDQSTTDSAILAGVAQQINAAAQQFPKTNSDNPITIGVGEPFTVAITVSFYSALLISLPLLLYEAFAFIVPALNPKEKRAALPVVVASPVLFVAGAAFTYIVVLPAAIKFLQGYNSTQFNSVVQAAPLYQFEVLTMAAIGLAFEMPLLLIALRAVGVIDGNTLTKHWRYATVIIAVIAAAMPGADPVTTGLETAPLVILFLASIVLLKIADRRAARREADELRRTSVGGLPGT
jgi:sec-independent protein translocase protein TatC